MAFERERWNERPLSGSEASEPSTAWRARLRVRRERQKPLDWCDWGFRNIHEVSTRLKLLDTNARAVAPTREMASATETIPTTPDMRVLWKIVTPEDLKAWTEAGAMLGSDLDKADGFGHSSNGAMVKKVAAMFFAAATDCSLLRMEPASWGRVVRWTTEEPADKRPPEDGSVPIHYLPDGCSHVFAEPLPMSAWPRRSPCRSAPTEARLPRALRRLARSLAVPQTATEDVLSNKATKNDL